MDNIHSFLFDIGIPVNQKGFDYLHDAIEYNIDSSEHCGTMETYEYIAQKYNTTKFSAERCIRTSIKNCLCDRNKTLNKEKFCEVFGDKYLAKGARMKNSEFIAISALHLK